MLTKMQMKNLKQIINRSNNKLFLKFLFLVGVGEGHFSKATILEFFENLDIIEQYFEKLQIPYISKFIEKDGLIADFIDILTENKNPINKIIKTLEETINYACPRARLEHAYVNTKGEIKWKILANLLK